MPPNSTSMYVSSSKTTGRTQSFTQRGRPGRIGTTYAKDKVNDYEGVIDDLAALSTRLIVLTRDSAIKLGDRLTWETKAAIQRHMPAPGWRPRENTGEPFEFSKGRLAAAWGTYTPEMMRGVENEEGEVPIQERHEEWAAENGVTGEGTIEEGDIGEEQEVLMGAIFEIKRLKGNVWTAEVGTFLPYAALANDGGTMWIYPYGNKAAEPVQAEWEGVHFIEEGIAKTEAQVENIIEGSINSAFQGQTSRRRVRNPRRRG